LITVANGTTITRLAWSVDRILISSITGQVIKLS
jgi:hypothetical protein